MSLTMEERLKRRKLDALKRGVHRVTGGEALLASTHVVGIGGAGAGVLAELLRTLEPQGPKLHALAIDIGEQDVAPLRALAAAVPQDRAELTILSLDVPRRPDLFAVLGQYSRYLTLEYPRYGRAEEYQPWLPPAVQLPPAGGRVRRAVAKAIYGAAYYGGDRPAMRALRAFAESIDAANSQAVVAIVFGMAGGTGSGIAIDVARHLSNGCFGRRVLVAGIGIAPCDGDPPEHSGERMFPLLNELDCLGDEAKNHEVVRACGELFRNPFTAGFIMVPQQQVWAATHDLAATQARGNQELAALLTIRGGAHLWELLRLLNWVAAPSTQHSAARTPWGPQWIHMLGFADCDGGRVAIGPDLPGLLGLRPDYTPELIELRMADASAAGTAIAGLEDAFAPDVPPQVVEGGRAGSVQFILPRITKCQLAVFAQAREAYDAATPEARLLDHAMLLEQGVLLCEPSTMLEGMAGASLWGGTAWLAVPLDALRGEDNPPEPMEALLGLHEPA